MTWAQTAWRLRAILSLSLKRLLWPVSWLALLLRKLLDLLVRWPLLVFNLRRLVALSSVSSRRLLRLLVRAAKTFRHSLIYQTCPPVSSCLLGKTLRSKHLLPSLRALVA